MSKDLETLGLEKVENKYLLTILVSKRVNQLKQGAKSLIEDDCQLTPYDIALREVVAGKVTLGDQSDKESPPTIPPETEAQPGSVEQNGSSA